MGSNERKVNIPMCAALILLCLTLISIHLTSGLYARYTVTSTGSDSARVAKFDVAGELTQDMADGKEGTFTLTVTNNSEVAVRYSVVIEFDAPMSVELDGVTKSPAEGETSVTFTDASWTLAPGADYDTHTLQFDVSNWVGVTSRETNSGPTEPVAFRFDVNVHAEQID